MVQQSRFYSLEEDGMCEALYLDLSLSLFQCVRNPPH